MSEETPKELRALAEETRASTADVDRLRALFPADLSTLREAVPTEVAAPAPAAEVVPLPRRRALPWLALVGGMAAAAAALVAVLGQPPADEPIPGEVAMEGAGLTRAVGEDVLLHIDGKGTLTGSTRHPRVDWSRGTVRVEVEPGAGIDLVVGTREAKVAVHGTVFSVERDVLGTRVVVERGEVGVTCGDEAEAPLGTGQERTCLPTTQGALLGRARALETQGSAADLILETVDQGLALPGGAAPVAAELRVLRLRALADLGRSDEALAEVDAYLDGGQAARREVVLRTGLALALSGGDCARALRYSGQLGSAASETEQVAVAACTAPGGGSPP